MLSAAGRELVRRRYAAVHGAVSRLDYPRYRAVESNGAPRAVLGWRRAAEGRLFLETYLDAPIEAAVRDAFGRPVARTEIVEIGDHASCSGLATTSLWLETARLLSHEAEIGVAVLTAPLRRMFARIGLPLVELAPADPARLGGTADAWGRYYDADPIVCAGEIAAGRAVFDGWAATARREAR